MIRPALLALCAMFTILPTRATGQNVAQHQERIAIRWVEALGTGDLAAMRAIRSEHMKAKAGEDWEASFADFAERLGGVEIRGALARAPNALRLVTRDGNGRRVAFDFTFRADARDQIDAVELRVGDEGDDNALPELALSGDVADLAEPIDAYIAKLAADDVFAGSVAIARGGTTLFEQAYGPANRSFDVPNRVTTRFDVGSITKDFTRVAVAQLVATGKLEPGTTVGEILPEYPNAAVREKVTVGQLFMHASGLPDYFDEDWRKQPMGRLRSHADYIEIWGPKPLLFEPGTDRRYTNYGFTVLGAIIEKVSGQPYFDYVAEHVFAPAGMDRSGFFATDQPVPDVAVGYTHRDGRGGTTDELRTNIYLEPAIGGPWGKTYSPARDLVRFWNALCGHQLVPPAYTRWVLLGPEPTAAAAPGDDDASVAIPECDGQALGGGGPGISAAVRAEGEWLVVVLANLGEQTGHHLAERLVEAVTNPAW